MANQEKRKDGAGQNSHEFYSPVEAGSSAIEIKKISPDFIPIGSTKGPR
jgi:hypothetical protein